MRDNERSDASLAGSPFMQFILRWTRSWQLGLVLAVIAVIFVVINWQTVDFSVFSGLSTGDLILSALAYGAALWLIAYAVLPDRTAGGRNSRPILGSGLAAQLLKYVPGTLWQGQRVYATGGMGAVARFTSAGFLAAGVSLIISGRLLSSMLGVAAVVVTFGLSVRYLGSKVALRVALVSFIVSVGVATSGAFVGSSLGLDAVSAGREVAGAWGFGILVVPVPAGLGVRELYLSLASEAALGPNLALTHRAMTLAVDFAIGSIGIWLSHWRADRG